MTYLIGRNLEKKILLSALRVGRHVLIEGPVGTGKTSLVLLASKELEMPLFRVDGDGRYSEAKLTGSFDPSQVIKKGYGKDSYIEGPLLEALKTGGILFINELNRMPEGVQNLLLPVIDEGLLHIPGLGEVRAHENFRVVATQNPSEFVGVSAVSEALMDRFERIVLEYPGESDEIEIVENNLHSSPTQKQIASLAVQITRKTREMPSRVRRGASLRGGISLALLAEGVLSENPELTPAEALSEVLFTALSGRIEIEREFKPGQITAFKGLEEEKREILSQVFKEVTGQPFERESLKKKPTN